MATFHAWRNAPLRELASPTVVGGRLQGAATLELADLDTGEVRSGAPAFELLGPGDVLRLAPGVVARRYPVPGAADAEETKAVLVEFHRADLLDLPWRYTPEAPAGARLRPWLVLVVGEDGEIALDPDGFARLAPSVQKAHDLVASWQWAHVHDVDGTLMARLLCPRDLEASRRYTACLVNAFTVDEATGAVRDAWTTSGAAPVRVPCYDHWSFRTAEEDDFPKLAELLRGVTAQSLGATFGTASVRVDRRGPGSPVQAELGAAGALQRPDAPPLAAAEAWVTHETGALAQDFPTPDGRWVLGAPRYHAPFSATGDGPVNGGWSEALRADPRHRGAAGLGAWAAIAWQDRIADAARTKAGDLDIARDRIAALALGLEASRSLWRRRLPADPLGQLAVLGPVLARVPADSGGTVLDALAGRTPLFSRALWSSAARRALRPGPARAHWAATGATRFERVIEHAAGCPRERHDADAIAFGHVDPDGRRRAIEQAILAAGRRDEALAREVADRLLAHGREPSPGLLAAILALLDPPGDARPDRDAIRARLDQGERGAASLTPRDLDAALERLPRGEQRCRPVDVVELARRVAAAVDPTVQRPPAVDRVLRTLQGVADVSPIELEPELDLPLWQFLAQSSPDWLLPGIGDLPPHRVVALGTNPPFVEALLVGANQQSLAELRFRNLPIAARWSPLRKFWHRAAGALDIVPIRQWAHAQPLGAAPLQPPGIGIEAVVVFRSPLFRRYPNTLVYLYPSDDGWPEPADPLTKPKVWPTFTGTIGDDVTFFGFPVPPAALASHWVVLEEPPAGYRFYTEREGLQSGTNAAQHAKKRFAPPVRVLIGALLQGA